MKRMRSGVLVVVVLLGLAAWAAEEGASHITLASFSSLSFNTDGPNRPVFILKAKGKPMAELRALPGATVEVSACDESGQVEYNAAAQTMSASHGVMLKLTSGTNSIVIKAEELEMVREAK